MKAKRKRLFDQKCFELARHFLGPKAAKELCNRFAEEIQLTVDDWTEFDREGEADALDLVGDARGGETIGEKG